jgi:MFS family permease
VRRPRFAASYAANAILVILSISPGLANGAALNYIFPSVAHDLSASPHSVSWLPTLGDAAIAFGGILAAELARHFEARRLYLTTLLVSLASCGVGIAANNVELLIATQILHGIVAGFMLVIALGPLIGGFGEAKLPLTTGIAIAALFGVASLGPLAGTLAASVPFGWRYLFALEMVLGLVAFGLARETLLERPPQNESRSVDTPALALAVVSTVLNFAGVSYFQQHPWYDVHVWLPLALGNAGLVALFVVEVRSPNPLLPVRELGRAYPLIGAFACVFASGAYAAATRGIGFFLTFVQVHNQLTVARILSLAVAGALVAAALYARVVATRWGSAMALVGLAFLAAGSAIAASFSAGAGLSEVAIVVVILSLGAGLTITPGLLTMALGVRPRFVGGAIALLALLRMNASYLTGPVLSIFATSRSSALIHESGVAAASVSTSLRDYIAGGGSLRGLDPSLQKEVTGALLIGVHDGFAVLAILSLCAIAVVLAIFVRSGVHLVDPRVSCMFSDGLALESPSLFPQRESAH